MTTVVKGESEDWTAREDVFQVAPGVWGVKDIFVNYYMIRVDENETWFLIDAGLKWSASNIIEQAGRLFGTGVSPFAIILTHGHFDHSGGLLSLLEVWDVPVYVHELELPYVTGLSPYPPADTEAGGGIISAFSFLFPQGPIDIGTHAKKLPGDGTAPGLLGWQIIHTPGIAPGHISLYRSEDKIMIAGDAFLTTRIESVYHALTFKEQLSGPPKYFTYDWEDARSSLEKLAALSPEVVATGHGKPMQGQAMRDQLDELLNNFEDVAIPSNGRYTLEAAITNKFGVASWPESPRVIPLYVKIIASAAIGFGTAILFFQLNGKRSNQS
ncbi:MAG: MBL fold metallo-hydrolase [Chryseolinea sp.]